MGQEIAGARFSTEDFTRFQRNLGEETAQLQQLLVRKQLHCTHPRLGLELEAWLVDSAMEPAPINATFLAMLDDPLASAELARFNIEFNTAPLSLRGDTLRRLEQALQHSWSKATQTAQKLGCELMMIGILPTLQQDALTLSNMSDLNRYRALNEQILAARGRPVRLDINGAEHLAMEHNDVMLESAATSLQIHTQVDAGHAHHVYNASLIASASMVAVCANSPYLFGKSLWQETRIPLFEQAVESGGFDGAAHGPVRRVSFGSDYARTSIFECFDENLAHFPVLLPVDLGPASSRLDHLRLHNGTIWRWNRPLVGFDNGTAHIRIEHRTPAAGPTVTDMIANAAFHVGLVHALAAQLALTGPPLPFSSARDNFYKAARQGLDAQITNLQGRTQRLQQHVLDTLLPLARTGLDSLGLSPEDVSHYLAIIETRVDMQRTGSDWQRAFISRHGRDFHQLARQYLLHQQQGKVVSQWPI